MKDKKSKMIDNTNKKSSKTATEVKKSKKKISIGKIIQKTVEVLKKPFSNSKTLKQNDSKDAIAADSSRKIRKTNKEEQSAKTKIKRKKETIIVDYPTTSLKKLEKAKEEKISNQKPKTRKRKTIKQKPRIIENDEIQDEDRLEDEIERQKETSAQISTEVNGFFYTNDKFITRFEDEDILNYLKIHYPLFMKDPSDFQIQKKQILDMLQNAQFIEELLKYYDINIYDFFKFLFRLEPDLFKGSFLKRIQKAMRYKKYAIKAKKCLFTERRRIRLRQNECYPKKSN